MLNINRFSAKGISNNNEIDHFKPTTTRTREKEREQQNERDIKKNR